MQNKHLLFILILLLIMCSNVLMAHKQLLHQHITREAFQLLKMSFPDGYVGFEELEEYLGTDETEETSFNPNLFYSIGERKIVAGSWYEDEYDNVYHYGLFRNPNYNDIPGWVEDLLIGNLEDNCHMHATITHFWDVDEGEGCSTHLDDTISGDAGSYHWSFTIGGNAMKKVRKLLTGDYELRMYYENPIAWPEYDNCIMNDFSMPGIVDFYNGIGDMTSTSYYHQAGDWIECDSPTMTFVEHIRKGFAYNLLGRMCHLLQDMTVPCHVHCTSHSGVYGMYSDHFEEHEMEYLNDYYYWSAYNVYNQEGRFLDPYVHEDPLYYLMYVSAQMADHFADGKKDGNDDYDVTFPGLSELMNNLEGPVLSSQISDESCHYIYDKMIPQAIRATAGLLYWFAVETGQIEQMPLPWCVSGNVQLADGESPAGGIVRFINHDNGFNLSAGVNAEGDFSKIFYFEHTGNYEIIYQKEGYYPVHIENVEITNELDLEPVILSPILSDGFVQVSKDPAYPGFYYIQDAVDYMQYRGDGVIIIREGTYTGNKNKNIRWYPSSFAEINNSVHLHICAPADQNVVIDCENSGCAFLFDEEEFGIDNHYNQNDIVENIRIVNAEQGIVIKNGSPLIINNIIENCYDYAQNENTHGVGISCYSNAKIQGNIIRNNQGNWNGSDPINWTYGGGIYVENLTSESVVITGNIIENCSAQEGGAIYCTGGGEIEISNNSISYNTLIHGELTNDYPGEGTAICLSNCDNVFCFNNLISKNIAPEHNGNYVLFVSGINQFVFRNNTVACDNQMSGIKMVGNDQVLIENTVFFENKRPLYQLSGEDTQVRYCNFYGNELGNILCDPEITMLYFDDPGFIDPENNDFTPLWNYDGISILIDNGDPEFTDLHNTPVEIGCKLTFDHDHHFTDLSNNYWNGRVRWVCFPVLDREIVNDGTMTHYVFNEYVNRYGGYLRLEELDGGNMWDGQWENYEMELNSLKGYKVFSEAGESVGVSGQKIPDDTIIELSKDQKNWVPYFIEKPQSVHIALASIWDHVISVASEDWFLEKEGYYSPERCVMIYGKMYDIRVDEDCELCYVNGQEVEPKERVITEAFSYEETSDYTPVLITGIDDPDVTEVGLLLDGQCIGATTVEEYPLQILAFVPEAVRGEGDLDFRFYTSDRTFKEPQKFLIYNQTTEEWTSENPSLNHYETVTVTFGDIPEKPVNNLSQNYPNPFNPETKIHYSVANEGHVMLTIYNVKGQKIKTLVDEVQASGTYNIAWDGNDEAGKKVTSGVYFYQIKSGNYSSIKKMLLIK